MASSVCFVEDLTCSVCLSVFTEPVMLLCGHSFCRECISVSLHKQRHCPVCRTHVPPELVQSLPTNHVLKSLVEKTIQKQQNTHNKEKAEFFCAEHDEKLKLYCITDKHLICVICRDSQIHESHKFKPVSEAAALGRAELRNVFNMISVDTKALETLAQSQKEEVDRTKRRSGELKSLISSKFEEMHEFLQKRERELTDKVKSEDEIGFKKMTARLSDIEAVIADNRKLEAIVASALQIQKDESFLRTWSEEKDLKAAMSSFKPKQGNFRVEKTDLSLGPYESHLQMFVWKEMLQVVTPREEKLLLKKDQTNLLVSQDQRSVTFCHRPQQHYKKCCPNCRHAIRFTIQSSNSSAQNPLPCSTHSIDTFEGQHYWEVYVGRHNDWELGLPQNYLKHNAGTYHIYASGYVTTSPLFPDRPQKIGMYLNCPRKELSFYNADRMAHLHTVSLANVAFPVSAYFNLGNSCSSHDPLVVCRY